MSDCENSTGLIILSEHLISSLVIWRVGVAEILVFYVVFCRLHLWYLQIILCILIYLLHEKENKIENFTSKNKIEKFISEIWKIH